MGKGFAVVRMTLLDSKIPRPTFVKVSTEQDLFSGSPTKVIPECLKLVESQTLEPETGGFGQMATIHGEGKGITITFKKVPFPLSEDWDRSLVQGGCKKNNEVRFICRILDREV